MWLLERCLPEKWGRPSARRNAAEPETQNSKHGAEHKKEAKPPKPGTPEYMDSIEEEPFPRNLSTCIFTPGIVKFYSTLHTVEIPYKDLTYDESKPSQASNNPTPEELAAKDEALFQLQEAYFALPKDQRIPFLHDAYQRKYGIILPEDERARTDGLFLGPAYQPAAASHSPMGGALVPSAVSGVPPEISRNTPFSPAPIPSEPPSASAVTPPKRDSRKCTFCPPPTE